LIMKKLFTVLALLISLTAFAKKPNQYVRISTAYGECIIRLYNETPKHRDNFIKLTKQGFYNGTLFHRVIQNFMIQGGDPDSKDTAKNKPGLELGNGDLKYTIPAEIRDSIFHKRGIIGAARDDNPAKASSATQFYIAEGKRFTDEELDKVIHTRLKDRPIPQSEREIYKTVGGVPHLDQNYTVFGEVVTGLDMVDRIAAVKKDKKDRPLQDVPMTVTLLKRRECRQMDKILHL
jgi:cyclophilin family peptidyl-prolyl cis-trans isomerase